MFSSQEPASPSMPVAPLAYTEIRHPIDWPSYLKMTSPSVMQGPATGQSPATPAPTIGGRKPYSITLDSNGRTLYRCECSYATHSKSTMVRHHKGTKHGRRYNCTFPDCTKSFWRKHILEQHEKTFHWSGQAHQRAPRGTG